MPRSMARLVYPLGSGYPGIASPAFLRSSPARVTLGSPFRLPVIITSANTEALAIARCSLNHSSLRCSQYDIVIMSMGPFLLLLLQLSLLPVSFAMSRTLRIHD